MTLCQFTTKNFANEVHISLTLVCYWSRGCIEWPAFEWIHVDCFPDLIQLACFLPQKEDNLRNRITKVPHHSLCHSLTSILFLVRHPFSLIFFSIVFVLGVCSFFWPYLNVLAILI